MAAAMHTIKEELVKMVCCVLQVLRSALRGDGDALQLPQFLPIVYILLCIPSSSVAVEKGFSVSGIVKTISRGTLVP
jgi:hypothetical protein